MDRPYGYFVFRGKIDDALKTVARILEQHRNPRLVEDVEHEYGDIFGLVDQMTNTALIGQLNVLSYLGLTTGILRAIDKTQSTTLRFQASNTCTFIKEQLVEIPEERLLEEDEQIQTSAGTTTKSTIKQVIKHVTEFHWNVEVKWEVSLYSGSNLEQKKVLQGRSSNMTLIIQSNKQAPMPEHCEFTPLDVSLTWLLKHIDTEKLASTFSVDLQASTTKTPRQNKDVESAIILMRELRDWTAGVIEHFKYRIQQGIVRKHNPASPAPHQYTDLESSSGDSIFVPVQPLMETADTTRDTEQTQSKSVVSWAAPSMDDIDTAEARSPLLSSNDVITLLNEQIRSIDEQVATLVKTYPSPSTSQALLSVVEATVFHLCIHSKAIGTRYSECVDFVESMLKKQLYAAVGKRIQSSDIDKFLQYHNARLLNAVPKAFCHPIRQPGHYPCGLLSIESTNPDGDKAPIQTMVREVHSTTSTKLSLNSATTIELTGQKFLHGWIHHRFGIDDKKFELIARARQFSAFLLVAGTMVGPNNLDPKEAIIVLNKDEYFIPLLLEEIPTAGEFKKAIRSLSPEQQRFAEAFRSMQLDSSVMGICVIQIKPQLEKLLGLPQDALMKEMKLTEDLIELFVQYQVPPDLLSYDGNYANPSPREMVDNVRGHAKAILDVIEAEKKKLEEQARLERLERERELERASLARVRRMKNMSPSPLDGWGGSCNLPEGTSQPFKPTMGMPGIVTGLAWKSCPLEAEEPYSIATMTREAIDSNMLPHPTMTSSNDSNLDVTLIPQQLNSTIEMLGSGVSLRSSTVKLSLPWRRHQEDILGKSSSDVTFDTMDKIAGAKNVAFDLLDAISRSGSLPIAFSELHVIVAVTHCFEKDVINTIIQDNINPIEKLEMSTLLLGSTIFGVPACELIARESDLHRLKSFFPALFANAAIED